MSRKSELTIGFTLLIAMVVIPTQKWSDGTEDR
jgi:hypothetical protein